MSGSELFGPNYPAAAPVLLCKHMQDKLYDLIYKPIITYVNYVPKIFLAKINLSVQRDHKNTIENLYRTPIFLKSKLACRCTLITV